MYTRFKNVGVDRHFGFLPEHGRKLNSGVQVIIEGDLRTLLATPRGKRYGPKLREMASMQALIDAGQVEYESLPEAPQHGAFRTLAGDGFSTVIDILVGFVTAHARVYVYDIFTQTMVPYVYVERGVPTPISVRLTFNPAPGVNELDVFVFA